MSDTDRPRTRVALVDLQLADCDHLAARLGHDLEVTLVVAPDPASPLARWAELGGYPWATDLEALTAVVTDAVAVGESSPRRNDALALAQALGARGRVLGLAAEAPPSATGDPLARLDAALEGLLAADTGGLEESRAWESARHAGFVAGLLAWPGEEGAPRAYFGDPGALEWLAPLARQARRSPRGWAQMALAEAGLWRAACALAPGREDGLVVALAGRLLPAHGYGSPAGRSSEAERDRRLATELLLAAERREVH